MADPIEYKDLSPAGKKLYDQQGDGIEAAAATINGQQTGIKSQADFERALMDMAGVNGISAKYPESVTTVPLDKEATSQAMRIEGLKPEDVKTLVDNLKNNGLNIESKADGNSVTITLQTSEIIDKIIPHLKNEFDKLGNHNPDLIRELQKQSMTDLEKQLGKQPTFKSPKEQAVNAVQNENTTPAAAAAAATAAEAPSHSGLKRADPTPEQRAAAAAEIHTATTTPAEAIKAGGVIAGKEFGLVFEGEKLRGSANFKVMQDDKGNLIAMADVNGNDLKIVQTTYDKKPANQEITATLKVDGKAPRQVTFEVAKDGVLTEKSAPPTPQGKAQSAEPMR